MSAVTNQPRCQVKQISQKGSVRLLYFIGCERYYEIFGSYSLHIQLSGR